MRGTSFRALPLSDYEDKKRVDHLRLLKARPDESIEYMRRSEELFHAFLGPFRSMEGEIGNLVD